MIDTFTTHGVVSTSPAVADIDGDNYLEIVFADWGQDAGYPNDTFWCLEDRWDSALPVELAAFVGQASEQGIQLQWLTLSEKNNLGFHVYRSKQEKGPYSRVSSVLIVGHGTDSTPHEYRFLDDTAMPGRTYWDIIEDLDFFGEAERSRPVRVVFDTLDSITQELPVEPLLHQNFPNPFNPETWFPFELSEAADVHIRVFNLHGHLVRQLDLGRREAGRYLNQTGAAHWDGRDQTGRLVESGLYFYQIQAGDFTATRRMVVLK